MNIHAFEFVSPNFVNVWRIFYKKRHIPCHYLDHQRTILYTSIACCVFCQSLRKHIFLKYWLDRMWKPRTIFRIYKTICLTIVELLTRLFMFVAHVWMTCISRTLNMSQYINQIHETGLIYINIFSEFMFRSVYIACIFIWWLTVHRFTLFISVEIHIRTGENNRRCSRIHRRKMHDYLPLKCYC